VTANEECREIENLFRKLCDQPRRSFPQEHQRLDAPLRHGVYIIRKGEAVLHVGRTLRAKDGLHQRLTNHLHGSSSFTEEYLKGHGEILRGTQYTFQYLEVPDQRKRALLEAYAVGQLCPVHLGLGG
jgi:hypothetical protein